VTPAKRAARLNYLTFVAAPPAQLPSLVIVVGKETVLADEVVRSIAAAISPDESLRALNVDVVDARGAQSFAPVAEKIAALPFLAQRRAVIVRGTIDLKKEAREELAATAAHALEHAVLLIDHSGKPARPQGRRPGDEAAAFAKAHGRALIVDCTLDEKDCGTYVERYAGSIRLEVEPAARDALAATEDVAEIKNTLDRLALTAKRVSASDVEAYSLPSGDARLWTLAGAVYDGDPERALRMAKDIGDPIGPLVWLAGDAQILWELRSGVRATDYAAATGQNFWRIKNLFGAAKSRPLKELRERVDVTMAALERSLTGRRDPEQALEEVIVRLAGKRNAP